MNLTKFYIDIFKLENMDKKLCTTVQVSLFLKGIFFVGTTISNEGSNIYIKSFIRQFHRETSSYKHSFNNF